MADGKVRASINKFKQGGKLMKRVAIILAAMGATIAAAVTF